MTNTTPNLDKLPEPNIERSGWPWTPPRPETFQFENDDIQWPKISIITPSYNQAEFIEESIRSVVLQGYPNLEYIVIDGGSTDGSVEIIKKYESYLSYWVSESDRGQSDALNKGFSLATGDLIGWQNSDDSYGPNALVKVAQASAELPEADVLYGAINMTDRDGNVFTQLCAPEFDLDLMIPYFLIHNECMFFRKHTLQNRKLVNEDFHHYMDYELFWSLILQGYNFQYVPGAIAYHRKHENSKSATQQYIAAKELWQIYKMPLNDPQIPGTIKNKLEQSCFNLCLDNFYQLRLDLYQQSFAELLSLFGTKYLQPKLLLKYLLSYMGKENLSRARALLGKGKV